MNQGEIQSLGQRATSPSSSDDSISSARKQDAKTITQATKPGIRIQSHLMNYRLGSCQSVFTYFLQYTLWEIITSFFISWAGIGGAARRRLLCTFIPDFSNLKNFERRP